MNDSIVTPAYGLFQELGHLGLLLFSDVAEVKRSGRLVPGCPFAVPIDDAEAIADPNMYPCLSKIASSPRFPWHISNLRAAIRFGERWLYTEPAERTSLRSNDVYSSSRAIIQQVLVLARKMVLVSPSYAKLAFGLTELEVNDLADATDAGMVEASAHVRLEFRSLQYRDVIRTYAALMASSSKDTQGLMGHIARMSGVAVVRG